MSSTLAWAALEGRAGDEAEASMEVSPARGPQLHLPSQECYLRKDPAPSSFFV